MRGTTYAAAEIIGWLLAAALVGFAIGWLLRKWFLQRDGNEELDAIRAEEADRRKTVEAELDDWKAKAASLSADLDHRRADVDRLTAGAEERDGKIAELESTISRHRGAMVKMEAKVEDRESTIASLRSSLGKEDGQADSLRREVDIANGTIGALRKDADGYKSTIDALRLDLDNERRRQADLHEELKAAQTAAESAKASFDNMRNRAEELEARIAGLPGVGVDPDSAARIAALEGELAEVRADRDGVVARLAAVEAEHSDCVAKPTEAVPADEPTTAASPAAGLPDKDAAVARVVEIATRTRGTGPRVEDDLKKIHGVGPKLEKLLKSMDITSFRQVAKFTADDIHYVTAALDAFPGRIERDDWMSSAAEEHMNKYNEPA